MAPGSVQTVVQPSARGGARGTTRSDRAGHARHLGAAAVACRCAHRLGRDDDRGVGGDERDLLGCTRGRDRDQRAARLVDLRRLESAAAAGLHRELVDGGALGVPLRGRDDDDLLLRDRARAHHLVGALEPDAADATRAAADGADVVFEEADALPARRHEQQLVLVPAREDAHDPVAVAELHRDDSVLTAGRLRELGERCALDAPRAR